MANGQRNDPLGGFLFMVDVKPWLKGAFRECAGLGSESEVAEYFDCGDKGQVGYYKCPGRLKWETIVLKRGITDSMDAWKWRKKVEEGKVDEARADGSIVMYHPDKGEVARWNFNRGWPTKLTGPSLNANSNDIGIEELSIVHEGLIRDH